jgi:D-alanyl-D-alanine carboxypeptidase
MALRATSKHENAPDTASFIFNHLRRAFNGAAGLPPGAELYVSAGGTGDLVAGRFVFAALLLALACTVQAANAPEIFKSEPISPPLLEKIRHTTWHQGCPVEPEKLRQLTLSYHDFNGKQQIGTLIVNADLANEVIRIFEALFHHNFPIERMVPIEEYGGDDNASMAANNTSAFNCRDATGKPGVFSNHSWGRAIDINPLTNPYVKGDKVLPPEGRRYLDRTKEFKGSILKDGFVVRKFEKNGWTWGGRWPDRRDYQHFEKQTKP